MLSLSVRPTFPHTPWIYTRLQFLSPKRAFYSRTRTFVQSVLSPSDANPPVQRSLAPQRVMLSRRILAYYDLIRASLLLSPVYALSSGSLPVGLLRAGAEKVPNLSCLSLPIVPSPVPRRLDDCFRLFLRRLLWPSPPSQRVGVRFSTLAGSPSLRGSCHEAEKFAPRYGPMELLALLRLGRLLSSFRLQGRPLETSSITTRANNLFPWPDLHRLDKQPYRLHAKVTKASDIIIFKLRDLRGLL